MTFIQQLCLERFTIQTQALIAIVQQRNWLRKRSERYGFREGEVMDSRVKVFIKECRNEFPAFILHQESEEADEELITEKPCEITDERVIPSLLLRRESR